MFPPPSLYICVYGLGGGGRPVHGSVVHHVVRGQGMFNDLSALGKVPNFTATSSTVALASQKICQTDRRTHGDSPSANTYETYVPGLSHRQPSNQHQ